MRIDYGTERNVHDVRIRNRRGAIPRVPTRGSTPFVRIFHLKETKDVPVSSVLATALIAGIRMVILTTVKRSSPPSLDIPPASHPRWRSLPQVRRSMGPEEFARAAWRGMVVPQDGWSQKHWSEPPRRLRAARIRYTDLQRQRRNTVRNGNILLAALRLMPLLRTERSCYQAGATDTAAFLLAVDSGLMREG